MGLLNEAIREHLELKRLRGADPSEVAREEQDALGGSAPREESGALVERGPDRSEPPSAPDLRVFDGVELNRDPDLSGPSQETVELDMRAILEAESVEGSVGAAGPDRVDPASAAPARAAAELSVAGAGDLLEWEIPGEGRRDLEGRFREEGSSGHRVFDARKAASGRVTAGESDSLDGAHDPEGLRLDRRPAHDLGVGW